MVLFFLDVDECVSTDINIVTCNTNTGGEICVNLPGTFKCECNANLGFLLIDGTCQSKYKRTDRCV